MQTRLAKLQDSDWQVGAVGEGGGGLWKTCWAWSVLANSSALRSGGGDADSGGHGTGTWLLSATSASKSTQSQGHFPLTREWLVPITTQFKYFNQLLFYLLWSER